MSALPERQPHDELLARLDADTLAALQQRYVPAHTGSLRAAIYFLLRDGLSPDECYSVVSNPRWPISQHARDAGEAETRKRIGQERVKLETAVRSEPVELNPNRPMDIARVFVREEAPHLLHLNGDWFTYEAPAYRELEDGTVVAQVYAFLEGAVEDHEKHGLMPFRVTKARAAEVDAALRAIAHRPRDSFEPPCWLRGAGLPPTQLVACRNGLLHLPTGKLLPPTPDFFTRNVLGFDFDPKAPEPKAWLQFLHDLWGDDAESIGTLQEWFGHLLVPDTSQQKILLLVGPKRSGKGTILRVSNSLIGRENVCAPSLSSLAGNFGLQPLIGKTVAVISDMRLSARTDQAALAENLLRISGEDVVTVDRKHKTAWTGRLAVRFVIVSNELPRFSDASGALVGRFVPLSLRKSFFGSEDPALTDKLLPELPGILRWSIEGWRRLQDRGRFVVPSASLDAIAAMEDLASPVAAFVRDLCVLDPDASVPKARLFSAFALWRGSQRHAGTPEQFSRDLFAAFSNVREARLRDGDKQRVQSYLGIRLAQ